MVFCLQDKSPNIRNMADTVVCEIMPISGYTSFQQCLQDMKPAMQQTLKPILEKIKSKIGAPAGGAPVEQPMNQSVNKPPAQSKPKEENKENTGGLNSSVKSGGAEHIEPASQPPATAPAAAQRTPQAR